MRVEKVAKFAEVAGGDHGTTMMVILSGAFNCIMCVTMMSF